MWDTRPVVNIRVKKRPNLDVVLSQSGFEPYADKQARVQELIEEGERAQREQAEEW